MLAISTAELAQIQADAAATLDIPCLVQRKAATKDVYGSETDVWNTTTSVNVGVAQPSGSQLQNYDYKIGSLASWPVHLPVGTDVKEQDHLVMQSQTLVVQVLLTPRSYQALLTVLASEVK